MHSTTDAIFTLCEEGSACQSRIGVFGETAPDLTSRALLGHPWIGTSHDHREAMVAHGIDTYLLDWGIPRDEDRYLSWELVLARLDRMVRRVKRHTGADQVAVLGYCMGGTLTTINTALNPEHIAALINLTGPIDFSQGGLLRTLVESGYIPVVASVAADSHIARN